MQAAKINKFTKSHLLWFLSLAGLLLIFRLLWFKYAPANEHFELSMQIILAIIMFLHVLYVVTVYIVNKTQYELIPFALFLFVNGFSILIDDSQALFHVVHFTEEWSVRTLTLTYILSSGSLLIFNQLLSKTYTYRLHTKILYLLSGTFTLLVLFAPFNWIDYIIPFVLALNLIIFSYVLLIIFRIFHYEDDLAFILILAAYCNLHNVAWGVVSNLGFEFTYYPFDFLFALFGLIAFLGLHSVRVSQERQKLSEQLQVMNQEKTEFLANTSHELRNPLHGIINIAESIIVTNREKLSEQSIQNLQLVASLGRHMTFTLNDLLDQSTNPKKPINLEQKPVQLHEVASQIIQSIAFLATKKDLDIQIDIQENLPALWADQNRLRQILFNLLHNAAKYTEHNGSITLKAEAESEFIRISVKDTGIGIKEELIDTIFDSYEQDMSNQIGSTLGTGLGLNICRKLIHLHGGEITVTSKENVGTTFTFTLPIATKAHQQEKIKSLQVQAEIATTAEAFLMPSNPSETIYENSLPKILIVDDDFVNLKVLYDLLHDEYAVTCVDSAEKAEELLQIARWDLIISDVQMPEMDGYELTKKVRERFSLFELPIILLTAKTTPEDLQTGFLAGANDYVAKPMKSKELLARVKVLTKLKQSVEAKFRMEAAWLQAQIQPHFLFNTLNTIASLGYIDTDRMVRLLNEFGTYLQHSFHSSNVRSLVPLHQELALLRSYLYIEKERFGDRLQVKYDLDDTLQILLPPLSIQPIVENAVRHGVLQKIEGGTVTISIKEKQQHYLVSIVDDGVGISEEKLKTLLDLNDTDTPNVGVKNTHRRLIQFFGSGLAIKSKMNVGTTVSFTIPKRMHTHKQKVE